MTPLLRVLFFNQYTFLTGNPDLLFIHCYTEMSWNEALSTARRHIMIYMYTGKKGSILKKALNSFSLILADGLKMRGGWYSLTCPI